MRITVTGGTGYIGSALVGQLLEAGHEVTALLLDQQNASAKAADVLGWKPVAPTLLEEFRSGTYAR